SGERISHLFFADDALFCFEASPDSCQVLRSVLEDFCEISDEIINYRRSHVQFNKNTLTKFIHFMRKPPGVGSQQNMGTYLGCPMDVDGRTTVCFTGIHDRFLKCISSWKYSCLSIFGRCILINNVLMALAAHIMSVYLFPKKILNRINSTILKLYRSGEKKKVGWDSETLILEPDRAIPTSLEDQQEARQSRRRSPVNTSWAFKSMVKCARNMLPGCRKRTGNGQSTLILEETWAGNASVKFKRNIPLNQEDVTIQVKELMRGRAWNASIVWKWFNKGDAQRILSMCIPQ
ncbi:hypothetical protein RDABS01_032989, partial [Bienertia sinuspersici]